MSDKVKEAKARLTPEQGKRFKTELAARGTTMQAVLRQAVESWLAAPVRIPERASDCPACGSTTYAGCVHTAFALEGKLVPISEKITLSTPLQAGHVITSDGRTPISPARRKWHVQLDAILDSAFDRGIQAVESNLDVFFDRIGGDFEDPFNTCPAPVELYEERLARLESHTAADSASNPTQEGNSESARKGKRAGGKRKPG